MRLAAAQPLIPVYDEIGADYAETRASDPRIGAQLLEALGDAASIVNVGAGTGSYEPRDRQVVAVEPSATMIRQRGSDAAPAVRANAEHLPLADGAADAALAVLTAHHWIDLAAGLAEMQRVARRRIVILTWDQEVWETFWLVREYLPCVRDIDRRRARFTEVLTLLEAPRVATVAIHHDCVDGFFGAWWRRPAAYLDTRIQAGISTFSLMPVEERDEGLGRLRADLESGRWQAQHADLLALEALDLGYRIIVAEVASQ